MDANSELIKEILHRNRNHNVWYSSSMILIAIFLAFNPWNLEGLLYVIYLVLTIAILGSGLMILVRALKNWDISNHVIMQLIDEQPDQVVWVYHHILESMPFGVKTMDFTTLHINLVNGRSETMRIRKREADDVLSSLRSCFPTATFGHSLEKEQLYRANPELLIRNVENNET